MRMIGILLVSMLAVALVVVVALSQGDAEKSASPDPVAPVGAGITDSGFSPPGSVSDGQSAVAEGRGPGVNPTIDRFGVPVSETLPLQPVPAGTTAGAAGPEASRSGPGGAAGPAQAAQGRPESSVTESTGGDPGIYGSSSGFVESDYIGPAPEDSGSSLPDMPPPESGGIAYDIPPEGFGEQPVGDPPEGTGTQ